MNEGIIAIIFVIVIPSLIVIWGILRIIQLLKYKKELKRKWRFGK